MLNVTNETCFDEGCKDFFKGNVTGFRAVNPLVLLCLICLLCYFCRHLGLQTIRCIGYRLPLRIRGNMDFSAHVD